MSTETQTDPSGDAEVTTLPDDNALTEPPAPPEPDVTREPDALAINLWVAYNVQAGGVTYDGRPLPNWDQLGDDRRACWQAVADAARKLLA